MVNLTQLRVRVAELERYPIGDKAPAAVRERAQFDLEAMRELLARREKDAGELPF